jgi:hypothetical protein
MSRIGLRLILNLVFLTACFSSQARAQSPEEVRRAFVNLHDDKVPHNCEHATDWLLKNREQLKDDLVDELYKTDWQGREAIFHILLNTSSFVPDDRFIRFFATTLPERVNENETWQFINDHFDQFDPLLKEQVSKMSNRPHDMYVLWATAWLAKKRGVFDQYVPLFTPAVLAEVVKNLKDDQVGYNASQAVRFFLLLGDQSLPTLREATKSSDNQTASLARATIDALGGKRNAFGFLASKLSLAFAPFGPGPVIPDWLEGALQPYLDRDTYP